MVKKKQISQDQETRIIFQKKIRLKRPKKKNDEKNNIINIKTYDDSEFHLSMHVIEGYAEQILGSRKTQQDMYAIFSDSDKFSDKTPLGWAVVCDGMGGMAAGEVASKTAIDVMCQILESTPLDTTIPEILSQAISIANEEVKKISLEKSEMTGTTLVSVVAKGNLLYYASVGDSRIYVCRGNEIIQLTRDHNYSLELDSMVKAGQISEEEALNSKQREALISYIGIEELTLKDVSYNPIELLDGDIIILCSDGLTKVLSDDEILDTTRENSHDVKQLVQTLLYKVDLDPARKLDNTTIVVLKYIKK